MDGYTKSCEEMWHSHVPKAQEFVKEAIHLTGKVGSQYQNIKHVSIDLCCEDSNSVDLF